MKDKWCRVHPTFDPLLTHYERHTADWRAWSSLPSKALALDAPKERETEAWF